MIESIFHLQKEFFRNLQSDSVEPRKRALLTLKKMLDENYSAIIEANFQDLRKTEFETVASELNLIYGELNLALKNIEKWSKPKKVPTNLMNQPGESYIYPDPYGVCLIIGAWNFPYLVTLHPIVSALAAGNTVILKPSELAPAGAQLLDDLVKKYFDPQHFTVIQGGVDVSSKLLDLRFDKIFFTGSTQVGRIVAEKAAKNLIPCTLELGGKSPVIVLPDSDLEFAARKLAFAKFVNAGQACVAPDYVYVSKDQEQKLVHYLKKYFIEFYGENTVPDTMSRIVSRRHFDRLTHFLNDLEIVIGGKSDPDKLLIAPTLVRGLSWDHPLMKEEIFGPILPILSYENVDDLVSLLQQKEKPLAFYIFGKNKTLADKIFGKVSFGGGCFNDCLVHLGNHHLPFGGVGQSGYGAYHGEFGFDCFSHKKAVLKRPPWFEPKFLYPPYTKEKAARILKILKYIS